MRVIPGTMHAGPAGEEKFVPLAEEPADMLYSTLVGCPAGAAILRDPRIWHGGPTASRPSFMRSSPAPRLEQSSPISSSGIVAG